jgi:hypothetical protein
VDTSSIRKSREGVYRPDLDQESPHGCYEGVVYIGHLVEADGEEVEVIEAVPCKRCQRSLDSL